MARQAEGEVKCWVREEGGNKNGKLSSLVWPNTLLLIPEGPKHLFGYRIIKMAKLRSSKRNKMGRKLNEKTVLSETTYIIN